ncbi:MAG: hypothetical protein R3B36_31915 [Polyangiaceae bacterium]
MRKIGASLVTASVVALATLASGQPALKKAPARAMGVQVKARPTLTAAEATKVTQTFTLAAKAYASDKDAEKFMGAGAALPANARATYTRLVAATVSANTTSQMAARYSVPSGQLIAVSSTTGCQLRFTAELTIKNQGAAVPANVSPKLHATFGVGTTVGSRVVTLPRLAAGASATIRLPEIAAPTGSLGGSCDPLNVSLAFTGVSSSSSYLVVSHDGAAQIMAEPVAPSGGINVGGAFPPGWDPGKCPPGSRKCANQTCMPINMACGS